MGQVTLAFNGIVAANGELTLVSKRLSFPFTVKRLIASFALGTDRTTQIRFFISLDNSAPSSGFPTGQNLLEPYGQVDYLVGDDERKDVPHEAVEPEAGAFVKVHALNTDPFDHSVDALVIIQALNRDIPKPSAEDADG